MSSEHHCSQVEMATENKSLPELQRELEILQMNSDNFFLIVNGIIIFLMQAGFAFLEAGAVRAKNTVNILIKNILDVLLGAIAYWVIGWGLAYGENGNPFCGGSQFFAYQLPYHLYPKWFFQFVFAATAATILSGAVAERCQFMAYVLYSVLLTGWVYPAVTHWAWDSSGWLAATSYTDFAGSGVVHLLGGTCGLVGCLVIGPRTGRFGSDGRPVEMPGHSVPLAGLGGFILLVGFLAFNGGSQASIAQNGDGAVVALATVNTVLAGSTGGLTVLIVNKFLINRPYWSFLLCLNGTLSGMVSLCAGCHLYEPWAALVVGVLGGLGFLAVHFLMLAARVDDPLDAVAVHAGGGLVGLLAVPFFMYRGLQPGERGVFWDGDSLQPWLVLGWNLAGGVAIMAWSAAWAGLLFGGLAWAGLLRVSPEDEQRGMDFRKHGESAYPNMAEYAREMGRCDSRMPLTPVGKDDQGEDGNHNMGQA